jgi:hypothetical protein
MMVMIFQPKCLRSSTLTADSFSSEAMTLKNQGNSLFLDSLGDRAENEIYKQKKNKNNNLKMPSARGLMVKTNTKDSSSAKMFRK